jgi:uncharacterized protein
LKFRLLEEPLVVCRLPPDALVPASTLKSKFLCVTRTFDELSVVCAEDHVPDHPPDDVQDSALAERGWLALKLEGRFPFSMTGVLASFIQPLAEAQIPIFAISTFDTDYVLIKRENVGQALAALIAAGHEKVEVGIV